MTTYEHSFATRTTKQTDYAVVKFVNGEEIIAEIVTSSRSEVTLSNPVQIHRIVNPIGHEMIRCSYWMLFNDDPKVTVSKNHIITLAHDVSKNTIRHYEMFLKHAEHGQIDENLGDMVDEAEEKLEAEKQMKKAQSSAFRVLEEQGLLEDDLEDDIDPAWLVKPAANTIH